MKQELAQRIDRALFAKVLSINPALAQSRTAEQVARQRHVVAGGGRTWPATAGDDGTLELALRNGAQAFLCGQRLRLEQAERKLQDALEVAQRAYDDAMVALRDQTLSFFSVLDAEAVRRFGAPVIADHGALLQALQLSPNELIPVTRRKP